MRIKVRFFAAHRESVGAGYEWYEVPDSARLKDIIEIVVRRHPVLKIDGAAFGLNRRLATPSVRLSDGDEVAILPPVSGG